LDGCSDSRDVSLESKKRKLSTISSMESAQTSKMTSSSDKTNFGEFKAILYFDGGSRGNPGIGGSGAFLRIIQPIKDRNVPSNLKKNYYIRYYCGSNVTNNVAEYSGLLQGLQQVHQCVDSFFLEDKDKTWPSMDGSKSARIEVFGDSMLVIQQMRGSWSVKDKCLKRLYSSCKDLVQLIQSYPHPVEILFQHIGRAQNSTADGTNRH
jgi:ribonuclease HI